MIHIVLYEPEIPQNTGNIMRTCVATGATLHLIKPLGFKLDEQRIRRSGMDYIDDLSYFVYENFDDFKLQHPHDLFYITRYGKKTPYEIDFKAVNDDIYLMFGKESTGIPKAILQVQWLRQPEVSTSPIVSPSSFMRCSDNLIFQIYQQ
ncbi:MAG: putative rRNA methylase (SpoU class) [Erysipelotrichaceae bacterium]|nr:MAG: putative rRNA methylase (SpoU class) [Erysipelotrichaceae bacterium]